MKTQIQTPNRLNINFIAALAEAFRVRLGWQGDELGETLRGAAAASRAAKVPPGDALEIIHRLESLEEQLILKRKK